MRSASARKRSSSAAVAASPCRRAWSRRNRSRCGQPPLGLPQALELAPFSRVQGTALPLADPFAAEVGAQPPIGGRGGADLLGDRGSSSPRSAPRPPAARRGRRSPGRPAGRTPPCAARERPRSVRRASRSAWRASQKGAYLRIPGIEARPGVLAARAAPASAVSTRRTSPRAVQRPRPAPPRAERGGTERRRDADTSPCGVLLRDGRRDGSGSGLPEHHTYGTERKSSEH